MITNEYNGLLCGIQQPQELADAVLRVVQDNDLKELLIKNGGTSVLNFNKEKMASETMKYYQEVFN
jgi:glycosyltransferase involved in cell wall biosynthesis